MKYSLSLVVFLVVFTASINAVKLTPEMERCAEQAIHMLQKETNSMYKTAITKILKDVQNGALAEAQKTVREVPEPHRSIVKSKYMVGECEPMMSCLDCPIEL